MKSRNKCRSFSTKPSKAKIARTSYFACTHCGENDKFKTTRLRDGYYYCYTCESEYRSDEPEYSEDQEER